MADIRLIQLLREAVRWEQIVLGISQSSNIGQMGGQFIEEIKLRLERNFKGLKEHMMQQRVPNEIKTPTSVDTGHNFFYFISL